MIIYKSMKKVVRLTESQLRNIIRETIITASKDEMINEGKFSRLMGGLGLMGALSGGMQSCTQMNCPDFPQQTFTNNNNSQIGSYTESDYINKCKSEHDDWNQLPNGYGYCYWHTNVSKTCSNTAPDGINYVKCLILFSDNTTDCYAIPLEDCMNNHRIFLDPINCEQYTTYDEVFKRNAPSNDNDMDDDMVHNCQYSNTTKFFNTLDLINRQDGQGIVYDKWIDTNHTFHVQVMILTHNCKSYTMKDFDVDKITYNYLQKKVTWVINNNGELEIIE